MKLVELKKFNPPPIIWTFVILLVGWAIKEYAPPEYAMIGTVVWGLVLSAATVLGVTKAKVYELATTTGVDLPPDAQATPRGVGDPGGGMMVVREAPSQSVGSRVLL